MSGTEPDYGGGPVSERLVQAMNAHDLEAQLA
jgi:hypothetical protein